MPDGKPAGVPAYSSTNSCAAASSASPSAQRFAVRCTRPQMCGDSRQEAEAYLLRLEQFNPARLTEPCKDGAQHRIDRFRTHHRRNRTKLYYPRRLLRSPTSCCTKPAGLTGRCWPAPRRTSLTARVLHHQPLGYVPVLELDDGIRLREGPAIVHTWPTRRRTKPGTSPWHAGPLPPAGVADLP